MSDVQNTFKHNKQRKQIVVGGAAIMGVITLLSAVSSFQIYKEGFSDLPRQFQVGLALFAVVVVEGAFVWLVFGFTRAFASALERLISFLGMCFLVFVMLMNIITHFMMVKGRPLADFQMGWLSWGAVTVFIAVLLIVLAITLADPVIRLIRLELKYTGRQQEVILEAKNDGLENDLIKQAMAERAQWEAQELAARILNGGKPAQLPATSQTRSTPGFRGPTNYNPSNFSDTDPK